MNKAYKLSLWILQQDPDNESGLAPRAAKRFRAALRKENFAWHKHNDRWTVVIGSFEHAAMERVLREISN
jgi:uncharacterized protein YecT (DUF1311 family)